VRSPFAKPFEPHHIVPKADQGVAQAGSLDLCAESPDLCALAGAVNPGKAYEFGSLISLVCAHRQSPLKFHNH
jgi:hypothetical protein